jgi:serine acetyltransferase
LPNAAVPIEEVAVVMTGATIRPEVTVGRGAIVGAGAFVTRDVAPNIFVGGVLAKMISVLPEGLSGQQPSGGRGCAGASHSPGPALKAQ